MVDVSLLIWLLGVGFLTGIKGPFTASGSLIIIPLLLFLGFDIKETLALNMCSSFLAWIFISQKFIKSKQVVWKFVPALLIVEITGAAVGAMVAVRTAPDLLMSLVGFFIVGAALLVFVAKKMGEVAIETSRQRHVIGILINQVIAIYAGFFGGGSGIMFRITNIACFGFTVLQSAATGGLVWVFIAGTSTFIFAYNGYLNAENALAAAVLSCALVAGSHFGAKLMLVTNPKIVKNIFTVFAMCAGLWILLK